MRREGVVSGNYFKYIENLFFHSEFALCLTSYFAREQDYTEIASYILFGVRRGLISIRGEFDDPIPYIQSLCKRSPIDYKRIRIDDLKDIPRDDWIIEYKVDKEVHYAIVSNYKVKFDPSGKFRGKPKAVYGFIYNRGEEYLGNIEGDF